MDDLPDHFYTLVGRVVVRTTELEAMLADLIVLLKHGRLEPRPDGEPFEIKPEDEGSEDDALASYREAVRRWREEPGSTVIKKLRYQLKTRLPKPYWADIETYLDTCAAELDQRHGVAHSVWLALTRDEWIGHRYPQPKKGVQEPSSYGQEINATEQTLREQVERLQRLVNATIVWRERVEAATA